jgi:hypothetical protein
MTGHNSNNASTGSRLPPSNGLDPALEGTSAVGLWADIRGHAGRSVGVAGSVDLIATSQSAIRDVVSADVTFCGCGEA